MSEASVRTLTRESEDILDEYATGFSHDSTTEGGYRRLPRGVLRDSSDETGFWEEYYLPLNIDSIEALRFIGFEKEAAQTILDNFSADRPRPQHRREVLQLWGFVEGFLQGRTDAYGPHDTEWEVALREMGMHQGFYEGRHPR